MERMMKSFSFWTGEVGFDAEVFLVFNKDDTGDDGATILSVVCAILVEMCCFLLRTVSEIYFAREREMLHVVLVNGVPDFGVA